jgi:hypothetical protein
MAKGKTQINIKRNKGEKQMKKILAKRIFLAVAKVEKRQVI